MKQVFTLLIFFTCVINLTAQTVIRGPYLQSPNHESVIIIWRTNVSTSTKVWFGTDSTNLSLMQEIANNVIDHTIELTGLSASTKYYYRVGTTTTPLTANLSNHYFSTHPVPGTTVPVRVWAIGDFGRGNVGQVEVKNSYMDYTGERGTDVWLWLGDNAYDDGTDAQYQSKVFAVSGFSDAFNHVPFWPSPGNHDYNTVWSESTFLGIPYSNIALSDHEGPYYDMVEVPQYGECGGYPSQLEVFYSFDFGDVHFLSLNSEVFDYTMTSDGINQMIAWIENDLQQNTRKFTIAYFHQPPYTKGSHDSDDAYELVMKAMREQVIPVLESYDVDVVVCGHSHVYERSYLIGGHYGNSGSFDPGTMLLDGSNGNLSQGNAYMKDSSYSTPEGTVYVVCGNSGSSESGADLNHPVMVFTHGGSGAMGSFIIDVNKNRLDGRYLSSQGIILDEFTILKQDMSLNAMSDFTICEGDSVTVALSINGGSDSLDFDWGIAANDTNVITLSPAISTSYTVTVTDQLTGQIETVNFSINVTSVGAPTITEVIPGTLGVTAVSGYNYQWYLNGSPIAGTNWHYYTPVFSGDYTVVVTDGSGCQSTSSAFNYNLLGIDQLSSKEIRVYPNPVSDILIIYAPLYVTGSTYTLFDLQGRELLSGVLVNYKTQLDLAFLSAGTYVLQVGTDFKTTITRE